RTRGRPEAAEALRQRVRAASDARQNTPRSGLFTCKDCIWEGGSHLECEGRLCFRRGAAMKLLLAAACLFVLVPAPALAGGTSLASRDVRPGAVVVSKRFDLVGLQWRGSGVVWFRTRSVSGRWGRWRDAAPEDDR